MQQVFFNAVKSPYPVYGDSGRLQVYIYGGQMLFLGVLPQVPSTMFFSFVLSFFFFSFQTGALVVLNIFSSSRLVRQSI